MNNSKLAIESIEEEDKVPLRLRETDLIEQIDALEHVTGSKYWKVLEEKVFNKDLRLLSNSLESEKNPTEIYRLQGEIRRAKKLDLNKMLQVRRAELQGIRKNLNASN